MFKRRNRNPALQPKWVQAQYVPEGATVLTSETVGNSEWKLGYVGQLLPTDVEPPVELLSNFYYLQALR